MANEELARANIIVTGQVQGVFFRHSTMEQAQSLSLTGWVQNLSDGSVEIVAEGQRYALDDLVMWCRRGPPAAKVEDVMVRYSANQNEFRTFMVIR